MAHQSRRAVLAATIFAALVTIPAGIAFAAAESQPSFTQVDAGAQLRDAIIDPEAGCAYFAAYNRNEVWKIDLSTGQTTASATVGKGPTALALSADGSILACVNRLSGSVSLIQVSDMAVAATVECGAGPGDVAGLPGGGFAVVNSLADSVTIVDTARPETPAILEGVTGVPNAVAASGAYLAVVRRVPPTLLLYPGGSHTPVGEVSLPDVPSALATLPGGRFAVLAGANLLIVDGQTRAIAAQAQIQGHSIATRGDQVLVLTDAGVEMFDESLTSVKSLAFAETPTPAASVAAAGEIVIALSPNSDSWLVQQPGPPPQIAVAKVEKPEPVAEKPAPEPRERTERVESVPLGGEEPTAAAPSSAARILNRRPRAR